jgi:Na+/melibiose symporter-like transporter
MSSTDNDTGIQHEVFLTRDEPLAFDPSCTPLHHVLSNHALGDLENNAHATPPLVSSSSIFVYSIANFGVTMAWSISFALTTPFFAQVLRAGPVVSHFIWALGPISGLVVAPLVGALSDKSTSRFGRRRPFIVVGTIVVAAAMLVFSNAPVVARWLLPRSAAESTLHKAAIVVASVAFAFSDFALNATMWPLRALQGDLVPASQQHAMQGASVAVGSLGDLAAQVLLSMFPHAVRHAPVIFAICIVALATTTMVLLFMADETPWKASANQIGGEPQKIPGASLLSRLALVPDWMKRLATCNALCFFAFFCLTPNFSTWFASSVLQGAADSPESSEKALRFERGVHVYSRAGIVRSLVQIVLAAVYPHLMKREQAGNVLGIAHACFGAFLLALSNTRSESLAALVVVMSAFPLSAAMTLVIAEVSARSDASQRGQLLGLLNVSTCLPQLVDTMYTGIVSHHFGEVWVVRIGALWTLTAAVAGFTFWPRKQSVL